MELRCVPEAKGYGRRLFWQQAVLRRVARLERANLVFSPLNIGVFSSPVPQVAVQRNAHHLVPNPPGARGVNLWRRRLQRFLSIATIRTSRENVFVSQYMVDLARIWVPEDSRHWHVIHNAVNEERFQSLAGNRPVEAPYILCVGLIEPHKNIELVIRAFRMLSEGASTELRLVIAGNFHAGNGHGGFSGWGQQLVDIMDEEGVRPKVILPGSVEGQRLEALYRHAEICVVPSRLESFGVVPAEALLCGTPSIVSDIPVFHEICGDAAMYCDPESPEDLARKIRLMLDDPAVGERLVRNAADILPRYRLTPIAEQYAQVLEIACQSKC
jgi:glycosyltransferase involved in cell wall biosynthesis